MLGDIVVQKTANHFLVLRMLLFRFSPKKFNAVLASSGYTQATCNALIVGGWNRGEDDRGSFGIKLDISLPLDLKSRAPNPDRYGDRVVPAPESSGSVRTPLNP